MNPIDFAFLVVLIYGLYQGYTKGFINILLLIGQVCLAVIIALGGSRFLTTIMERVFRLDPTYTPIIAFIFVFAGAIAGLYIVGNMLEFFAEQANLTSANRVIGMFLWTLILAFGFSYLLNLSDYSGVIPDLVKNDSRVYPYIGPFADVVFCKLNFLPGAFSELFASVEVLFTELVDKTLGTCKQ